MPKNDVKETNDMTKSEMVFKPEELLKSQELVVEKSLELERWNNVSDAKAREFMKMLKRSEYAVMEHLKKAPYLKLLPSTTS